MKTDKLSKQQFDVFEKNEKLIFDYLLSEAPKISLSVGAKLVVEISNLYTTLHILRQALVILSDIQSKNQLSETDGLVEKRALKWANHIVEEAHAEIMTYLGDGPQGTISQIKQDVAKLTDDRK